MKKVLMKEFLVIGMGRFGTSVAKTLAESGCNVLAVDSDAARVNDVADCVTRAMVVDVTNAEEFASLGASNFDAAIIAIASSMEISVMATILAKEAGIKHVVVKANSEIHAKVLKKVGADLVLQPEMESGQRIAHRLAMGNFLDIFELTNDFSMMEIDVPESWIGKTLIELNLRSRLRLNVVAIKSKNGTIEITPDAAKPLEATCTIVVVGSNASLKKLTLEVDNNKQD